MRVWKAAEERRATTKLASRAALRRATGALVNVSHGERVNHLTPETGTSSRWNKLARSLAGRPGRTIKQREQQAAPRQQHKFARLSAPRRRPDRYMFAATPRIRPEHSGRDHSLGASGRQLDAREPPARDESGSSNPNPNPNPNLSRQFHGRSRAPSSLISETSTGQVMTPLHA